MGSARVAEPSTAEGWAPISRYELLARLRALLRRTSLADGAALQVRDLFLDPATVGLELG